MAAKAIVGTPANIKGDFTSSDLTGAETITATVGAGQVALVVDSGVSLATLNIDTLVERLRDAFRETVTKLA